jgi:proline iminopeptidase
VRGLLLSCICLVRNKDMDWSANKVGGVERVFPDIWESRVAFLQKYGTVSEYAAKILNSIMADCSADTARDIAVGVMNWEFNLGSPFDDMKLLRADEITDEEVASAKVYLHYEANDFFLEPNQILNNIDTIRTKKSILVHGRYDLLCPMDAVWALKKELQNARLVVLPSSGHKISADGEIARALAFNSAIQEWELE